VKAVPVTPRAAVDRYRLRQSFRYDYDAPAYSLLHRLVVVPPRHHGDQVLRLGAVRVSDDSAQVSWVGDEHGNRVCIVRLKEVTDSVTMHVEVEVERPADPAAEPPPSTVVPPWADSRDVGSRAATWHAPTLPASALADPTLLGASLRTVPDAALRRLARELAGGDDVLAAAMRVCEAVPDLVAYTPGATTVWTTAAEALAGGQGVCQDQAHVMISVLRAAGIPCRYVSGHLVGQGGTHAWVEVVVPAGHGARAVAFDPTHRRLAQDGYVTVAVGRDYVDVPPTSGWYSGDAVGVLSGTRELVRETA
jgi:transglutaminase-like putative cysteine protease